MGMTVTCRGDVVWSPGESAGRLFLDGIQSLERMVGRPSGVVEPVTELVEIDIASLGSFIAQVLGCLDRTNSGPLFAMTEGCLAVAIALHAQVTGTWPDVSTRLQHVVARARTVMQPVPW